MKDSIISSARNTWSDKIMHRTETIFDAVLAIAMTMIALEISLPEMKTFDYETFQMIISEITVYFISFVALASIWMVHAWIYAAYEGLGRPLDIFINILLMFFVTIFPLFSKSLSSLTDHILNWIYLVPYILMEILLLVLLISARHISNYKKLEILHDLPGLIDLRKHRQESDYKLLSSRIDLLDKYADDPSAFSLLYREAIESLPSSAKQRIIDKERAQGEQQNMLFLFFIISFIAVTASVLSMMWNIYFCYGILLLAIIVFILLSMMLRKKKGSV